MDEADAPSRDKETVGIFLTNWVGSARLARSTVARYRSLVAKQILAGAAQFARFKLHEIDGNGQALLELDALLERHGESASTVRKVHIVPHSAFEDAQHLSGYAAILATCPRSKSRSTLLLMFGRSPANTKPRSFRPSRKIRWKVSIGSHSTQGCDRASCSRGRGST
jgi:hypothetical protein